MGARYLHHDECDGLIITVGHKDQVSSSCITLTLLTPLPVCKCAQFRRPSSREQTNPFNNLPSLTGPRSTCVSVKTSSVTRKSRLAETQASLGPASPYSCYLDQNAGVWTATGLRTVKPRTQRI